MLYAAHQQVVQEDGQALGSRYHSCVVEKERYLWAVARYIEQNPVRAKMVERAVDYPYSSAKAHIGGTSDEILSGELFPEEQREDYAKFIRAGISEKELNGIRYHTRTGRPFGSEGFIKLVERLLERKLIFWQPGRPRRKQEIG